REHGIRLTVATAPLNPALVALYDDASEFEEAVERISQVVPLWDFSLPAWPANRPELWRDLTHFRPELGRMMLDRMFDHAAPSAPKDFGRLRQPRRLESTRPGDAPREGG